MARVIRLLSDLHIEFGKFKIKTIDDIESDQILVLAGDIGERGTPRQFIEEACSKFEHVIYVLGNHEFYGGEYFGVIEYWREREAELPNLHLLQDQTLIIDDIRFIGATMWSCLDKDNWFCKESVKHIADYHCIKIDHNPTPIPAGMPKRRGHVPGKWLKMEDTMKMHDYSKQYVEHVLSEPWDGKNVVVTHHSPSHSVTHPKWAGNLINGAFHGHLEYLMERFDITYWLHGHTHDAHDIEIYGTRVICNPRGYVGYEVSECDLGLKLDI